MPNPPKALTHEEANRFRFHPATPESGPKHDEARQQIHRMASVLCGIVPEGRHRSMMLTSLQEAMWAANAGIAIGQ